MNQRILCHFELVVNEKYYQFSFQPGVVNFDDLDSALMAFKAELEVLKEKAIAAEAEAKAKVEQEAAGQPEEAPVAPVEDLAESVEVPCQSEPVPSSPAQELAEVALEASAPAVDEPQLVC